MFSGFKSIKVTPEELINQAEEVRRLATNMQNRFEGIKNTIENSQLYWTGEAGDIHRKLYKDQMENVEKMLKRLMEHPDDLLKISGNYKAAEKKNVETAMALDVDIIE